MWLRFLGRIVAYVVKLAPNGHFLLNTLDNVHVLKAVFEGGQVVYFAKHLLVCLDVHRQMDSSKVPAAKNSVLDDKLVCKLLFGQQRKQIVFPKMRTWNTYRSLLLLQRAQSRMPVVIVVVAEPERAGPNRDGIVLLQHTTGSHKWPLTDQLAIDERPEFGLTITDIDQWLVVGGCVEQDRVDLAVHCRDGLALKTEVTGLLGMMKWPWWTEIYCCSPRFCISSDGDDLPSEEGDSYDCWPDAGIELVTFFRIVQSMKN